MSRKSETDWQRVSELLFKIASKLPPTVVQQTSKIWSRVRPFITSFPTNIGQNLKNSLRGVVPQIVAIIVAFLVGAVVLAATGHSPIDAYAQLLTGCFRRQLRYWTDSHPSNTDYLYVPRVPVCFQVRFIQYWS